MKQLFTVVNIHITAIDILFEAKPARTSVDNSGILQVNSSFMPLLLSLFLKLFVVNKGFCIGKIIYAINFLLIETISIPGKSF